MAFYPGQKVVCVDASAHWFQKLVRRLCGEPAWSLKVRAVYTVERCAVVMGVSAIELVELKNISSFDYCFRAYRFRPLTRQEQTASWTQGAPKDSKQWDNRRSRVTRRRQPKPVSV